jgi:polysaccharide deacetylase 2 family uncharacterized protein YibQ
MARTPVVKRVLAGSVIGAAILASLLAVLLLAGQPGADNGNQRLVASLPPQPAGAAGNRPQLPLRGRQVLADAPDPLLIEERNGLALPRISDGGQRPWRSYARPFDGRDDRPRIAVIIAGFGLNAPASEALLGTVPEPVALAIDPYVRNAGEWARRARRFGHETLALLPVQGADAPFADAGPGAWSPQQTGAENRRRLLQHLAAVPGAVGVLAYSRGDRGEQAAPLPLPLSEWVRNRGLLLVDGLTPAPPAPAQPALAAAAPLIHVDVIIDPEPDAELIDQALQRLEQLATEQMSAVGLANPLPLTIARLQAWERTLAPRGFVLAPVTAAVGMAGLP